ncbi:hypothetical protein FJQ54_06535 [Sandaracinobacter neustonicus]|uniref:Uncharacterized protein n=1 Tax=Sandaracinobacter neustonicus TaxID=1715348 RepID=A0A501XPK9_9SPHN|nr:hypothetical protein [Sandaracinobacter neustonicus]TPE62184.1 hypothetical protein FJQ54_06535 [Sandaracinobacter neustonicus]
MRSFFSFLLNFVESIFGKYINTIFNISANIFDFGELKVGVFVSRPDKRSVDERISKLEVAREALSESLTAIDQLKESAQKVKAEYENSRKELNKILESKQDTDGKLKSIRDAMQQDITTFRELAGVPNVNRERWIAFLAGILASIISAGIVAIIVWGWSWIF